MNFEFPTLLFRDGTEGFLISRVQRLGSIKKLSIILDTGLPGFFFWSGPSVLCASAGGLFFDFLLRTATPLPLLSRFFLPPDSG